MDFSISEEQQDLVDLSRQILGDLATHDRIREVEAQDDVFDEKLWRALADASLLGASLPEEYGGSGYGFFELCLLLEEVGRATAPIPMAACLAAAALPVVEFGSDAQKRELLPRVASGDCILTVALREFDRSSPLDPSTRAVPDGTGWLLTGSKTGVASARRAEKMIVPSRIADGEIALFLVSPRAEGVRLDPEESVDRQAHCQVVLSDVAVGTDDLLGTLEGGTEALRWIVEHATVAACAVQLGVSERALEHVATYGRERVQFDQPIGGFQAYHQRAGDGYINAEAIRLSMWEAAWRLSNGLESQRHVEVAKYWAAEGGQYIAYAAVHLHGGIGIDVDYPVHRYFIWSAGLEHSLGSAASQLSWLGADLATHGAALDD